MEKAGSGVDESESYSTSNSNDYGAFIQRFQLYPPTPIPATPLPLQGLTFAIKDIFDVNGYVSGFGNPDWARTHAAATSTAPVVSSLIEAGATCVGKTIMDEMAMSVNGENKHYGTPTNPCAADRAPGGSSSGSAVAVAAKLVDFSLGTDTGGSVRVPAAYCGIFGFRPSHGAVSTSNIIPFAQSFDTVGWFARDLNILAKVGSVILQFPFDATTEPSYIIVPEDCFECLGSHSDRAFHIIINYAEKIFGSHIIKQENLGDYIFRRVPSLKNFMGEMSESQTYITETLSVLCTANKLLQRFEFKANHSEWLNTVKADFGPGILERLSEILMETCESIETYNTLRIEFQAAMDALLEVLICFMINLLIHHLTYHMTSKEDYGVLVIPTVTGPPPKLQMKTQKLNDFRANAFRLICIAGLSGICQITIPLGMHDNLPLSISLLARKGKDHFLLTIAQRLYATAR